MGHFQGPTSWISKKILIMHILIFLSNTSVYSCKSLLKRHSRMPYVCKKELWWRNFYYLWSILQLFYQCAPCAFYRFTRDAFGIPFTYFKGVIFWDQLIWLRWLPPNYNKTKTLSVPLRKILFTSSLTFIWPTCKWHLNLPWW